MATKTSLLGLTKPAYTEAADIAVLNTNFDLIDKATGQGARVQNLLDNSWFANPVAQAGQNGMHGSNKYVCDRWISWDNDATFANGYMTPGSPVDQRLDPNMISQTKTYTVAICLPDGTIKAASGTFASGFGSYALGVLCAGTTVPYVRINTGTTVRWAALYEGTYTAETLPAYVYKGYAAELAECMRYYQKFAFVLSTVCHATSASYPENLPIRFSVPMRIAPTVTLLPTWSTAGELVGAPTAQNIYNESMCFSYAAAKAGNYIQWHGYIEAHADL